MTPTRRRQVLALPAVRNILLSGSLGLATLVAPACGNSENLRPQLESDLPTTTGLIVYSEEGDGPKYVDMYFEAERRWPELTPDLWARAATHLVDGGTWEEAADFMIPEVSQTD